MHNVGMLSIIIPTRNEKYLHKTVKDLLAKSVGAIEIIVVLEGYWPSASEIIDDKRVIYLHFSEPRGMREAINAGVAIAKGEYIMKTDAHCMFSHMYDYQFVSSCKDNTVIVPRRYRLDPEKWEVINDGRAPVDYEYLAVPDTDRGLYGVRWEEKAKENKDILVDEIISAQGSCWVMRKSWYEYLNLLDSDKYGKFFLEFQEISLKTWLSGGKVLVDKTAWYAHYHKTKGRGYALDDDRKKSVDGINKLCEANKTKFNALIKKFNMPGWKI